VRRHHQVLILGGGPAGASAAHALARRGVDVALVDKSEFPRDKLCGGLLTARSRKVYQSNFETPWDEVISHVSHGARFFHDGQLLQEVVDHTALFFTRRLDFDHFLLNQAIACGTEPYLADAVVELVLAGQFCRLRSGREIGFDFLIGADGVNSLVAKTLFGRAYDPRTVAFALEVEVERSLDPTLDAPEIHFGLVRWGYGWVFPKRDTLTVGVGGLHARNPDLKAVLHDFLAARFGTPPTARIKGHHLPFGDFRKVPGRGNVLLCGDAAGLVEPITGEGIAFALQSGLDAALALTETFAEGGAVLPRYQARYRHITRDFQHANRLRYLIFPRVCEHALVRALPGSSSLPRQHLALMAGDIEYADYARQVLARSARRLLRKVWFQPRS
jgi:geranylgeranyl reductase family protein